MAAKPSASPAMAFILSYLKEKGDCPYAEVKSAAEEEGHTIYPIMYGRAKTLLGLITEDSRARRRRRPAADRSEVAAPKRPARLRQGGTESGDATAQELSSFLERFRELEGERNRYRAALLSVERLLRDALDAANAG